MPPGLPPARGDERRLAQALLNLVGNAIKFTDKGEVAIEVAARKDALTFSVRDTGPGIAEADQAKIFEEFRQVDGSITKTKMGSGLGLAIAKRIVEMHGGRIWVNSSPGAGATFSFTAPAQSRMTGGATMRKTILVVEDQEDNRQILRDLLGSAGFRMIEAHDGEQALTVARSERPNLILMDIQLPILDGYEATRSIKRDPELKHIPVIAVTSYALSGDEERAREAGCDGYVAKPYSPRHLLAKIGQFLERPLVGQRGAVRDPPRILIVDDNENNRAIIAARLGAQGYSTAEACDGVEALEAVRRDAPDLILLDVSMPRMDGLEACRRLRSDPNVGFVPIILVTARADSKDVVAGLEAGADEYLTKPVDQPALVARVRSMLRIKELHDRTKQQAAELAAWNDELERRVAEQVVQIERASRLKRFLSPQVADLVLASPTMEPLESHRREVTVVFCDLRGFTAFAETAEPEEVMAVLREYHAALGALIHEFEGTLERFVGDGVLVSVQRSDPLPGSRACGRREWLQR